MSTRAQRELEALQSQQTLNEIQVQALGAYATVALAEEQHAANLIAWHRHIVEQGDMPDYETELAGQIIEALS